MTNTTLAWQMVEPDKLLQVTESTTPTLASGEVLVEVAGCGLCHTDLGFLHGGVRTRKAPPLTLGHEIAGTVVAVGPEARLDSGGILEPGRPVIVPAVLPCGDCPDCRSGRDNICPDQKMPGNDLDGGFATHMAVPSRFLIPVDSLPADLELRHLAVVADAVTTPYQALLRGGVVENDQVIVIGVGGIGIYGVQIAAALGARVLAVDVVGTRIDRAREHGAIAGACTAGLEDADARKAIKEAAKSAGWGSRGWKVFEMSGTAAGQRLAFSLLTPAGTLGIVGFTRDKLELRLSNLMAFDAHAFGSWGCSPRHYVPVLGMIAEGRIAIKPFVSFHALSEVNTVLGKAHRGEFETRPILVPQG